MHIAKKLAVTVAAAGMITGLTISTSLAGITTGQDQTGAVTVTDKEAGTSAITLDMSPGGVISWASDVNEFALATTSANANAKYRMEYGIYSPMTGYYQTSNADTTTPINTGFTASSFTVGANPFSSWTYMGNSSN